MQVTVAEQKAFQVQAGLTFDQARERAWDQKMAAFGVFSRLLLRPKGDEIKVASIQRRFDPVWHVVAHKRLVFHRRREYRVPVADAVVRRVTVAGADYEVLPTAPRAFTMPAVEHCEEDLRIETLVDAVKGTEIDAPAVARAGREEIPDLAAFAPSEAVVVAPEVRASTVAQRALQKLMTSYEADQIDEESIEIEQLNLLYHPMYSYQYVWEAKGKQAVIDLDAVTGEVKPLDSGFQQQIRQFKIKPEVLFDLGAETLGSLVPGGSIAFRVAKFVTVQRRQTGNT